MTWCVSRKDCDGVWSWGEARAWTEAEWGGVIEPKFRHFSEKTWGELDKHVYGGKDRHKMHHSHEISDIVPEAQARWLQRDLEEFETVFRFRLGAKQRAWGFILQAHFHLVWWDRAHQIYPVGPD